MNLLEDSIEKINQKEKEKEKEKEEKKTNFNSSNSIKKEDKNQKINSPEISEYDIWSDHELEQLNQLLQSNINQIHPKNSIIDNKTNQQSNLSIQSSINSTTDLHHQITSPQRETHTTSPSSIKSTPLLPQLQPQSSSNNESHHSPQIRKKKTHSSFFTTGANRQIPMELGQEEILNSEYDKRQDSLKLSTDETNDNLFLPKLVLEKKNQINQHLSLNSLLTPTPSNSILDSSQPIPSFLDPSSIHPPKRALSSIFQTGAGRPYPSDNDLPENKVSTSTGENEGCPVFGFQTGRGASVSAPSEQSIRKALDLCITDLTTPFPKRPYKEPESPSPSHRAKIQKSSQFQVFEPPLPAGNNRSSSEEISTNKYAPIEGENITQPSAGLLLSTGAGAPVNISSSAIERSRGHLDDSSRFSEHKPTSVNSFYSPLKDVSNLEPTSSHSNLLSMKADLLAGSHQSDRPISSTLMESLNAVTSKIPSQPTTAASLMSTPIRPIPKMFSSSSLHKMSTNELTSIPPTVPHMVTAPVRRISNRMQIGLTPQSSKRISHDGHPTTESRPFVTPFKKNIHGFHSNLKSILPSNHSLSTPARDSTAQVYRHDDTPLSNQTNRRVMYMEPTHCYEGQKSNHKSQSVCDLESRMKRRSIPMRVWLGPYKGYTARNLLSLAIPESVVFMTSKSSVVWTFNPWTDPFGSIHALDQLLKSGCSIARSSPTWVLNHWSLIVWKLAAFVRWRPDCLHRVWNPAYVVDQLKYRFEREFVHGHRSIIMRILDGDCPPNIPMCLLIVGIVRKENHSSSASSQQQEELIELSDGWYKIKAVLDPVLSRTLKRGALKIGFKIAIFGASTEINSNSKRINSNSKLDNNNKLNKLNPKETKITKKEEKEEESEMKLYLEGNSTSRAKYDENLGFRSNKKPWFASLKSINLDGGKIPLLDLIIIKIFNPSFVDLGDRKITHQSWDLAVESKLNIAWENEREKELNKIIEEERIKFERIENFLNKILNLIDSIQSSSSPKLKLEPKKNKKKNGNNNKEDEEEESAVDDVECFASVGAVALEVDSVLSQSEDSQFDPDEMCEELIEEDEELNENKQEINNNNNDNDDQQQKQFQNDTSYWNSKINQISLTKLIKLKNSFHSKISHLTNNSNESIQKKLDIRVPIRKTRQIQLLQVEDFHYSTYNSNNSSNNGSKNKIKKNISAQLIVHDLSLLSDGFFKLGSRYWVQNLYPQNHPIIAPPTNTTIPTSNTSSTPFDTSKKNYPLFTITTRRDSHWIPVGLND